MIRSFNPESDVDDLLRFVVALQNFECEIDTRMPSGESIANDYIQDMYEKNEKYSGDILIAEIDGLNVGYVQILSQVTSDLIEDGDYEYALVSDLYVDSEHRGSGVGKELLKKVEAFARSKGANWLRISVMAQNSIARSAYEKTGFTELYVEMEKTL